jgi:nitrile hydratase subunit beta
MSNAASLKSTYTPAPVHRYSVGDKVTVKHAFPPIRGKQGVIERICGTYPNPEELAYGFDGKPEKVLYRVRFLQSHVWPGYAGPANDIIEMEIYEHWLEPAGK